VPDDIVIVFNLSDVRYCEGAFGVGCSQCEIQIIADRLLGQFIIRTDSRGDSYGNEGAGGMAKRSLAFSISAIIDVT